MRRRTTGAVALVALLCLVLAVGACGETGVTTPPPGSSLPPLVSPVTGVLTHIDSQGLSKVTGFILRTPDGRETKFEIGILEDGDQFPPGHLAEHMANTSPVRVFFRDDGSGNLVVYRLEDG